MARLALPDCHAYVDAFTLSPEDRRELVRRIAAGGPDAIDAFIREREQEDGLIARKVQQLRDELMKRADDMRARLHDDYAEKLESEEAAYKRRLAALQSERANFSRELDGMSAREAALFRERLAGNPMLGIALDASAAARPPWWRRVWRGLLRVLRFVLSPLLWLLRLISPPPKKHDKRVLLTFPSDDVLSRAGDLYLADEGFRGAVRSQLKAAPTSERMRRAWERLLGREDYETLARNAMAQMLADEQARAHDEAEGKRHEIEEALSQVQAREEAAARERKHTRESLREMEERDAKALEESLRNAPEQDVKSAIVEELQSAGLLRASGGRLMPTLQFMDRFASLVYSDETAGPAAGGSASMGEQAEGEGNYIRGPMRSAIEVSRMDIPASLLRARSRHPRVRHLTDDDVVVHREDRALLTHVVLIVDRSGSMEEHGRMDAAKRAALALHHAVRAKDKRNPIDVLLMDTSVKPVSLRDIWETEPRGFTNTGGALKLARQLIERRRSGRTLVYLVTDGLPEAYTKDGEDVAGHPDKAMAYAKEQARHLAKTPGFAGLVMLLLEPEDEMYVEAAATLAKEAQGRVIDVDPKELARTLLQQFETGPARRSVGVTP